MKKLLFVLLFAGILFAQEKKEIKEPGYNLFKYYFVMLSKGDNRTQPDSVAKQIQAGHMKNISTLAEKGFLICAGPFADDKGGGIFIFKADSLEQVKEFCESDPAVKSGRLKYEARPWYTEKGTFKLDPAEK